MRKRAKLSLLTIFLLFYCSSSVYACEAHGSSEAQVNDRQIGFGVKYAQATPQQAQRNIKLVKNSVSESLASAWGKLVSKHVDASGGVSYLGFARDSKKLQAYLDQHRQVDLATLSEDGKKALYINLYNAFMIAAILRYVKENNIDLTDAKIFLNLRINKLKVKGGNIWNGSYKTKLGGYALNLDDIEHGLLRRQDKRFANLAVKELDPRIHMAVNCAAMSCPRLRQEAYFAHNVNKMLDANMREFVNAGRQLFFKNRVLQLNKILMWYYHDFDNGKRQAGDYLARYLEKTAGKSVGEELARLLNKRSKIALRFAREVSFFYDWKINDRRNFDQNKQ